MPKLRSFKLPEFMQQIEDTSANYDSSIIDALCDTKARVVDCIKRAEGRNDFKLPHRKTHRGRVIIYSIVRSRRFACGYPDVPATRIPNLEGPGRR